jgi:hypothetical protein
MIDFFCLVLNWYLMIIYFVKYFLCFLCWVSIEWFYDGLLFIFFLLIWSLFIFGWLVVFGFISLFLVGLIDLILFVTLFHFFVRRDKIFGIIVLLLLFWWGLFIFYLICWIDGYIFDFIQSIIFLSTAICQRWMINLLYFIFLWSFGCFDQPRDIG